jgi:hypothetical protein
MLFAPFSNWVVWGERFDRSAEEIISYVADVERQGLTDGQRERGKLLRMYR